MANDPHLFLYFLRDRLTNEANDNFLLSSIATSYLHKLAGESSLDDSGKGQDDEAQFNLKRPELNRLVYLGIQRLPAREAPKLRNVT